MLGLNILTLLWIKVSDLKKNKVQNPLMEGDKKSGCKTNILD